MNIKNGKKTHPENKALALLGYLLDEGIKIFSREELMQSDAPFLENIDYNGFTSIICRLAKAGRIDKIKRGLYIVNSADPISEYEIAMHLVKPVMVSHQSAFRFHDLTDQAIHSVTISTLKSSFVPQNSKSSKKSGFNIRGVNYKVICQSPAKFFGEKTAWIGDACFKVTDLEKTFIDGLDKPKECGGFSEVIWAFEQEFARANLSKIIEYGMRMDTATARRLGWVLDNVAKVQTEQIDCLAKKEISDYRLLDASRPSRGKYCSKWKIRENHHYED